MLGRIIDLNTTDAFVSLDDGTTININLSNLPYGAKVGDSVNIDLNSRQNLMNDKLVDIF